MSDKAKKYQYYRVFGDSHVIFLRAAVARSMPTIKKAGFPLISLNFLGPATSFYRPFYVREGSKIRITDPALLEKTDTLCKSDGSLINPPETCFLISLGMHTQTFLTGGRWMSHCHWRAEGSKTRHSLSDAAFAEMVLDLNREILSLYSDMLELGYHFSVLSAPPPTRRFSILELGYSAEDVLFLDGRVREIMTAELNRMGISVIGRPQNVAPDGYLDERYLVPDVGDRHHGNIEYSALFLSNIAQTFGYEI